MKLKTETAILVALAVAALALLIYLPHRRSGPEGDCVAAEALARATVGERDAGTTKDDVELMLAAKETMAHDTGMRVTSPEAGVLKDLGLRDRVVDFVYSNQLEADVEEQTVFQKCYDGTL